VRSPGLIGPLAGWELRRLARRGLVLRAWLLLLYFLALVFVVFAALWFYPLPAAEALPALFRLPPAEADRFADRFALVLLEAQLAAAVALTPALAASAVAEEKDRHTLPLLLTTELTDREIVFGKAAGRVAFALGAATASLPVVALTLSLGRVGAGFLFLGYVLTLGTVALCAAIGLDAACRAPDFRSALLRAYGRAAVLACGALVPPFVLASPFGLLAYLHGRPGPDAWLVPIGCGYALAQAAVALLILSGAARALRLRDPSSGPPPVSAFPLPPRPAEPPLFQPKPATRPPLPPPDAADPVLWKERCVAWRPSWAVPSAAKALGVLAAAAALALFAGGSWTLLDRVRNVFDPAEAEWLARQRGAPDNAGWFLTAAGVFAAGRYLLPLSVGLSGAVAGERFRGTLDALLSTPLDRRGILRAKVHAHAERGTPFVAVAFAAVGMAFTADADIRLGASGAALVLAGVALVIGAGAWLTVRSATDVRAFRLLLPVAVLAVGWPVGAWSLLRFDADVPRELLVRAMLFAAIASAVAGAAFWLLAGRKLERGE
jgi:ABC-type transport system involved in multi-copper enzyme maturation permease subunit